MTGKTQVSILVLVWAIATAIGEGFAVSVGLFPSPASKEAHVIDSAMTMLTVLAVPIFTMVVVLLGYSMVAFRQRGEPIEDGPPIQGNLKLEVVWVAVTVVLVLFLAGYGAVGFTEVVLGHAAHAAQADDVLVVQAQGNQWFWEFYYPAQNVRTKEELRLPLGRTVRFEVTSNDVVHSFWVPAFRTKIDAVPGLITTVFATPDKIGAFQQDYHLRVQCAELCGLGHAAMATPVVVVDPAQFDAWVAQQARSR